MSTSNRGRESKPQTAGKWLAGTIIVAAIVASVAVGYLNHKYGAHSRAYLAAHHQNRHDNRHDGVDEFHENASGEEAFSPSLQPFFGGERWGESERVKGRPYPRFSISRSCLPVLK